MCLATQKHWPRVYLSSVAVAMKVGTPGDFGTNNGSITPLSTSVVV